MSRLPEVKSETGAIPEITGSAVKKSTYKECSIEVKNMEKCAQEEQWFHTNQRLKKLLSDRLSLLHNPCRLSALAKASTQWVTQQGCADNDKLQGGYSKHKRTTKWHCKCNSQLKT